MRKVLSRRFFDRSVVTVARELLGKFLVRRRNGKTRAIMITEVEAYDGTADNACHASKGLTPRTKIMFGEAGRFYVYFTYGMHWLLNIVTGPKGYPAAVLIREGIATRHGYCGEQQGIQNKINGPARITRYLRIGKLMNGKKANRKTGLWLEDRGVRVKRRDIIAGKRVGVEYAGAWANKPYNFRICSFLQRPLAL